MALLEVEGLEAQYGWTKVLHGIRFAVEDGGITTILGANGAGKTTTLRAVCGMVRTAGEIRFDGARIAGRATEDIVRLGIAHVPEGRGTFMQLTVEENLRLGAYARRATAAPACRGRRPSSAGTTPSDARTSDTEPMEIFVQQVVSGLATGGIYGSVALALVMIYQATDVVNFAQGEMAMFSTYLAWSMLNAGVPYWAAFFATLAVAFVCGVVIERVVIRPVENAPVLTIVIVCIGLLVILNSVAGWIYSYIQKPFPSPFPEKPITIGNVFFGAHDLGAR